MSGNAPAVIAAVASVGTLVLSLRTAKLGRDQDQAWKHRDAVLVHLRWAVALTSAEDPDVIEAGRIALDELYDSDMLHPADKRQVWRQVELARERWERFL